MEEKNNSKIKIAFNFLKFFSVFLFFCFLFFGNAHSASATAYYGKTGAAQTLTNWWTNSSCAGTGSNPSNFTTAGDTFTIESCATMTAGAGWTVGNATTTTTLSTLTINNGGTLAMGSNTLTLQGTNFVNAGTFTSTGAVTIAGTGTSVAIGGFTTTGTVSMTKTAGTATFTAAGSTTGNVNGAALTINGSGGTLDLGTSLTHTFTGDVTLTAGSLLGDSSTLNENHTSTTAWGGTGSLFTAGTSTVSFGGAAQTISATATTFNNLSLVGTGKITMTNVITINGIWIIGNGTTANTYTSTPVLGASATLEYSAGSSARSAVVAEWPATFTSSGGVIIAGTGAVTMGAAKVMGTNANVPLQINNGATLTGGTYLLTLEGNFINNGTFTGSGGVTITGTTATQSIGGFTTTGTVTMSKAGGTATFTAAGSTTGNVSGTGLTISGSGTGTLDLGVGLTHTFSGVVTLTSGSLLGDSSTLKENATSAAAWGGTGSLFTAGTSTVSFGGAAQTISATATTFNNLSLVGTGAVTFTNTDTINGIWIIGNGTTANTYTSTPVLGASATLEYSAGSSARSAVVAEWPATFTSSGGVIIAGTGAVTMGAAKVMGTNANVPLQINNGATLTGGTYLLTLEGNFINNGTFTGSGGVTITGTTATQSIGGFTTTGTLTINKASGTATLTAAGSTNGNVTTAGFTMTSGAFDISSNTLTIGGTVTNTAGTFTANSSTGTVSYTGGTQTIIPVTYYNLTFNGAGTKTATGVTTVTNNFTDTAGTATMPLTSIGNNFLVNGEAVTLGAGLTVTGDTTLSSGTLTMGAFSFSTATLHVTSGTLTTAGMGANNFTVTGATTVNGGTLTLANSSAINLLSGAVAVSSGTLNGASTQIQIANGIAQSSTGTVNITGTTTFQTNNQALSGTQSFGITTVATGITLTNNGTTTVTGVLTDTGNWKQGGSSTLNYGSATILGNSGAGTFNASTNTNTVSYTAASPTCQVLTYSSLSFTGSGTVTCSVTTINSNLSLSGTESWTLTASTNLSIAGTLTIGSGTTFSTGANTLTLSSTGTPLSVSGTFLPSTGTVIYTGNGATSTATTYNNLGLEPSSSGQNIMGAGTYTINGNLTIGDGTNNGATAATNNPTINLLGNLTISAGATYTKGSGTTTFESASTQTLTDNTSGQDLGAVEVSNMPITQVEAVSGISNGSGTITVNLGKPTTTGELVVVEIHTGNTGNDPTLVTDNQSNTYTKLWSSGTIFTHYDETLYYLKNAPAGITTITITENTDILGGAMVAHYTGVATASPVDVSSTPNTTGSSSPWASGSITTTNAKDLLVGTNFSREVSGGSCSNAASGSWMQDIGFYNAGAGFDSNSGNSMSYSHQIVSSIQTNIQNTGTNPAGTCVNYSGIASFKITSPATLNLGSSITATSVTVDSSQTLVLGANTLTLTGTGTPLTVNGTLTTTGSTISYTGTTANLSAITYNNLTLSSGTYTAPSGTLTLNGSLTNNGTFVHNSGTVVYNPGSSASTGYSYYRAITIDHTKVPNTDQTSFPVLVCFNGSAPCASSVSGLNQSGGGAHVQNANGYDIVFGTNSSCSSLLKWEVEKYVASTGELEAWVTNTTTPLSHTADTTIYMCYGNSSISTFQGGAKGSAWDANYKAVYHFPNGTTLSTNDSTSNGNDGTLVTDTDSPTAVAGQIDGGVYYDSNHSDYIDTSNLVTAGGVNGTFETWIKITSNSCCSALMSQATSASATGWSIVINGVVYINSSIAGYQGGATTISTNTWHHIVVVTNATGAQLYLDGNPDASFSSPLFDTGSNKAPTSSFDLGFNINNASWTFSGDEDEVRFSSTNRSPDWIKTEYNNQSNPNNGTGQFYSMGSGTAITSSSSIGGSNGITFNNFTVSAANGAGNTLQFKNGNTYTFAGTLSLAGKQGSPLQVKSTTNGSQWLANLATTVLSYIRLQDSGCSGGSNAVQNDTIIDGGNNGVCWLLRLLGGGGTVSAPVEAGSGGGTPVSGGSDDTGDSGGSSGSGGGTPVGGGTSQSGSGGASP